MSRTYAHKPVKTRSEREEDKSKIMALVLNGWSHAAAYERVYGSSFVGDLIDAYKHYPHHDYRKFIDRAKNRQDRHRARAAIKRGDYDRLSPRDVNHHTSEWWTS